MWWISGLAGAAIRPVLWMKSYSRVDIAVAPLTYNGKDRTVTARALDRNETQIPNAVVTITYATQGGSAVAAPRNAGTYKVTARYAGDGKDYEPSEATADLVIAKAAKPLVIAIRNKSVALGTPVEALTAGVGGPIGGDKLVAECETTATAASKPGDYPITLKSLTPAELVANYDRQVTDGTYSVARAKPTIAITSASSYVYDRLDHEATYTVTGVPNFPAPKATVTYTRASKPVTAPREAGTYAVSIKVVKDEYYNEATLPGQIAITKPKLTVTLPKLTKTYGAPVPILPAPTLAGAISGDSLVATSKTDAKATSGVGRVAIALDAITPPEVAANYELVVVPGELTIARATPTINFGPAGPFDYDAQPHTLTATVVGVGTDKLAAPTVTYTNRTTKSVVAAPTDAGTYDVSADYIGNANYEPVSAGTQLVIKKVKLKVAYPSASMTEGDPLPPLDATVTGTVGNDQFQVTCATAATSLSAPGHYAIARGTIAPVDRLVNYDMEEAPGDLEVIDRAVIAERQAKVQFDAATVPKADVIKWARTTKWLDDRITALRDHWKELTSQKTYVLKVTRLAGFPAAIVGAEAARVEAGQVEALIVDVETRIKAVEVLWARIETLCEPLEGVIAKVDQVCPLLPLLRVTMGQQDQDRKDLQYDIPFRDQLPNAYAACDLLLTKWTQAETRANQIEPLVKPMRLMRVHSTIVGVVVGNNQVAELALSGKGFSGFRNHELTADLKGWWSIRLGGESAGHASVAIHAHNGGVLEVVMTAEHNSKNEYVKRNPSSPGSTFSAFLAYRPSGGSPTSL